MPKSKIILFVVIMVVFLGAVIGGAAFWSMRSDAREKAKLAQDDGSSETLGASTYSDGVSLNGGQSNSGGLSVNGTSGASNLGQLTPNGNGGQSGNSQSASGSSSGSSSGSNSKSIFDPATFQQYDKYKNDQSGLFADVEKGTGTELAANMKAAVYYKGWLTNGSLFDQNKTDGKNQPQPFIFTEGAHEVIPGWEQALAGMKVGGTRFVIVPPAAGYGAKGQGPIPPNSVLIFQVQLVAAQ